MFKKSIKFGASKCHYYDKVTLFPSYKLTKSKIRALTDISPPFSDNKNA